jgi:hypothetical protein
MLSPEGLQASEGSIPKNGGYEAHNDWNGGHRGLERGLEEEAVSEAAETNLGIRIDAICRVLFPFNFILFNVFYWGYYLNY